MGHTPLYMSSVQAGQVAQPRCCQCTYFLCKDAYKVGHVHNIGQPQ